MGPFLGKCKPTLLIGVLSDRAGERLEAIVDKLWYLYFDVHDVDHPRWSPHIRASSHWNYLICQPEIAATLSLG
jgi:hypothetical protein